ncbi:AAA family ATPase [Marinobacter sp. GN3S48]|uniref:AAA family ATPase n=1 Tax=Marinobacter sp. GN3S48 TaxID=3382302 RepID=UPI00387B97A8
MARGELIKKLLESYGDENAFRAAAEVIISEEESKRNQLLAKALRRTLNNGMSGSKSSPNRHQTVSRKQEAKGLMPLASAPGIANEFLEEVDTAYSHKEVVLSAENKKIFSDLIVEFRASDKIEKTGLPLRSKLLFCGPPGCGKTMSAGVFAREIGLPLYVVKIDRLMSSFLGETATNIRKIFEFATKQPCILFLDEFDALARARDDASEHSELRRVVNSLLLFIDRLKIRGYLIAATNYEKSLDQAIWRRFDEIIWFEKPNFQMIDRFLKTRFKNARPDFSVHDYVHELDGYSYAELERVCIGALRNSVIQSRDHVSKFDFEKAWQNEERRRKNIAKR